MHSITLAGREIDPNHPPFIVAEMSGNHNGNLERALAIIDAIADAGAHAVKFQTYTPDTITLDSDHDEFFVDRDHELWGAKNLYALYEEAHTPWEWHEQLFAHARNRGLIPFSSPFDLSAVELLEKLDAPAYKIASAEIVDLPLIQLVARTGKPVIISTGAATMSEIAAAVEAARNAGCEQLLVMGCTASYPADPADCNLRKLPVIADALNVPVGYSDHTLGVGVSVAAVALGACMIEKHVTTNRDEGGVDSAFSLDAGELKLLVNETERAWAALQGSRIGPEPSEQMVRRFRRSLYVTRDVKAGERVTPENIRSVRPANGLSPATFTQIEGMAFTRDVPFATPTSWDMFV